MTDRTHDMLMLETAAGAWWDRLTSEERRAYVRAHPASRFAGKIGGRIAAVPGTTRAATQALTQGTRRALHAWTQKSPRQKTRAVGRGVTHVARRFGHHAVHHLRHEARIYGGAAAAVHHVVRGRKWRDLAPHHKKSLKTALVHAGISAGSLAMGDVSGHGGIAIHHLLAEFAHHHAHHALLLGGGEVGLKTGLDAARHAGRTREAAAEVGDHAALAHRVAHALALAEIPPAEWADILASAEAGISDERE